MNREIAIVLIVLSVCMLVAAISALCIVCANDDWDDKDPARYGSDDDLSL